MGSEYAKIWVPFPPSTLIHTCGSMSSGHRRALDIMMPLSMEKESLGNPSMVQSRILTGSPSTVTSLCKEGGGRGRRPEELGPLPVEMTPQMSPPLHTYAPLT